MITDTLPSFIREAFEWIGTQASGIWDGLRAAFTGEEAETGIGQSIEGFVFTFRTKLETLPEKIRTALQWVKDNILPGNKPVIDPSKFLPSASEMTDADFKHNVAKSVEDIKNGSKEALNNNDPFDFGSWVAEMGETLVDIFETLGPYILEGINKAFEWLGKQLSSATDFLNRIHGEGQSIDEAVAEKMTSEDGEESALFTALNNIGATIKNLILDVIPKFITAAIDELKLQIPKLFSALFGDNTASDIEQNTEAGLEKVLKNSASGNGDFDLVGAITGLFISSAQADEVVDVAENVEAATSALNKAGESQIGRAHV